MWYKNIAQQFISLGHMEAVTVASSAFCPLSCWKCAGKGQRSVLTGLGVRVAVTLSAAVRWGLFVVLFLREAQGQRLGGAGTAIGLLLSKPAVSAALLRAFWEVKGHAALRLLKHTHTHKHTAVKLSRQWLQDFRKNRRLHFEYLLQCIRVTALDLQLCVFGNEKHSRCLIYSL